MVVVIKIRHICKQKTTTSDRKMLTPTLQELDEPNTLTQIKYNLKKQPLHLHKLGKDVVSVSA